jgi:MOB kinase activator 1
VTPSEQPVKVSARQYCSYLMDWVQQQLDDEAIFPSAIGVRCAPREQPRAA